MRLCVPEDSHHAAEAVIALLGTVGAVRCCCNCCVFGVGALTRSGLWTGGCLVTKCLLLRQQSAPVSINPYFITEDATRQVRSNL